MEYQKKENLEVRIKYPKGLKMPKTLKTLSATLPFASNAERKAYMKLVALTAHQARMYKPEPKQRVNNGPTRGATAPTE